MNRFLVLVFVVASAYAQECSQTCSPQPVVIQLSCGNGQPPHHTPPEDNHHAPPHHEPEHEGHPEAPAHGEPEHEGHPEAPAHGEPEHEGHPEAPAHGEPEHEGHPEAPAHGEPEHEVHPEAPAHGEPEHEVHPEAPAHGEPEHEVHPEAPAQQEEELPAYEQMDNICQFDYQGKPITHPPGGWPEGFEMRTGPNGEPRPTQVTAGPALPTPPEDWNGEESTLGFPMPARGTAHFNMLMCWPISTPTDHAPAPAHAPVGASAPMAG